MVVVGRKKRRTRGSRGRRKGKWLEGVSEKKQVFGGGVGGKAEQEVTSADPALLGMGHLWSCRVKGGNR